MKKTRHSFEQPEFDFNPKGPARAARDKGMERVVLNTPEWWRRNYFFLMMRRELMEPFTGEDFRLYATEKIGNPHHYNSWGAHWNIAVTRGYVVSIGKLQQMKTKESHARRTLLYRWGSGMRTSS